MSWPKTAIIHEWLVSYAGSERCVESFTNIWQDADVFALVDFLNEEPRNIILKGKKANTTFIQKLPLARRLSCEHSSLDWMLLTPSFLKL